MSNKKFTLLIAALVGSLFSCSSLFIKDRALPLSAIEAETYLDRVRKQNQNIIAFKGLGTAKIITKKQHTTVRMAWVGHRPGKLRIELYMGAGVGNLISIVSDGHRIRVSDRSAGRHYEMNASGAKLNSLLNIPIRFKDVVALLGGRLPVAPDSEADIKPGIGPNHKIIILKKKWWGNVQKIYYDNDGNRVTQLDYFGADGTLETTVKLQGRLKSGDYVLPKTIHISNNKNERFELRVDQFWPNPPIKASFFDGTAVKDPS